MTRFKLIIASIFLVLMPYLDHVSSFEVCQVEGKRTLYCLSGYCCGTCNFRFCCNNPLLAVNQTQCSMCMAYSVSYMDYDDDVHPPTACDPTNGEFCCGSCSNRYCCRQRRQKLDQSTCDNNLIYENDHHADYTSSSTSTSTPTSSQFSASSWSGSTSTSTSTSYYLDLDDLNWFDWFRSTRPNRFWSDPDRVVAKWILIVVGIFCFVFTFFLVMVLCNKRQQAKRLAVASRKITPAPTVVPVSTISTIDLSADRTSSNLQDIHNMYNSDLSLLPNYESVKRKEPKVQVENEVPK